MHEFNLENVYGKQAVNLTIASIEQPPPAVLASSQQISSLLSAVKQYCESVCLTQEFVGKGGVPFFLNRLLGLPVSYQAYVFSLFSDNLKFVLETAKRNSEYSEGICELGGRISVLQPPTPLELDGSASSNPTLSTISPVPVLHHVLSIDRGISFSVANAALVNFASQNKFSDSSSSSTVLTDEKERDEGEDGFYMSKQKHMGKFMVLLALGKAKHISSSGENNADGRPGVQHTLNEKPEQFRIARPNTG